MSLFDELNVYHDGEPRSAALNMAADEALLELVTVPTIRFYRWDHPALSFGYFGKFADMANFEPERELVRRWTGGGIVFHGEDLTYSIVIPASDSAFSESSMSIYEKIHRAIQDVLGADGAVAELAASESQKISEACFANSVRADVMLNGRKIAGAAQRRTRHGRLHQGSIQHVDLAEDFTTRFAKALSSNCNTRQLNRETVSRAQEIAKEKYDRETWLRLR